MASKEINHSVELIMAQFHNSIRRSLPRGFFVDNGIIRYMLTVLDFSGSTKWPALKDKFDASSILNARKYGEISVVAHDDHILLVGFTLLGDSTNPNVKERHMSVMVFEMSLEQFQQRCRESSLAQGCEVTFKEAPDGLITATATGHGGNVSATVGSFSKTDRAGWHANTGWVYP